MWQDSTNADNNYKRNLLRNRLLPFMEQHFNPRATHHMAQTAELLRADVEYLEHQASQLFSQACSPAAPLAPDDAGSLHSSTATEIELKGAFEEFQGARDISAPPSLRLNRVLVRQSPVALQRRVVRMFLQCNLKSGTVSFGMVERILPLLHAPTKSKSDSLPGCVTLAVEGDYIIVASTAQDTAK